MWVQYAHFFLFLFSITSLKVTIKWIESINTKWLANPNRGYKHSPRNFWSVYMNILFIIDISIDAFEVKVFCRLSNRAWIRISIKHVSSLCSFLGSIKPFNSFVEFYFYPTTVTYESINEVGARTCVQASLAWFQDLMLNLGLPTYIPKHTIPSQS